MPRKARGLLEGEQHHVIIKGHNGDPIVSSACDSERLLLLLAAAFAATGGQVAALGWALLTNHMHLVLEGPIDMVSGAMHAALGPYAQVRNLVMEKRGRVFVDRFWSSPIHDELYQMAAFLYTLLNPLKAGIVRSIDELATYGWCNLGELLGGEPHPLLPGAVARALDMFGTAPAVARVELRAASTSASSSGASTSRCGRSTRSSTSSVPATVFCPRPCSPAPATSSKSAPAARSPPSPSSASAPRTPTSPGPSTSPASPPQPSRNHSGNVSVKGLSLN